MKLTVTIYGVDNAIRGEIIWDGTKITAHGSRAVQRAASDPIYPMGRGNPAITTDEPEEFMRNLYLVYGSPYFSAAKAIESQ
jgi:hypothetical protein